MAPGISLGSMPATGGGQLTVQWSSRRAGAFSSWPWLPPGASSSWPLHRSPPCRRRRPFLQVPADAFITAFAAYLKQTNKARC